MDPRRFEIKTRLTAEEVVLFDNIADSKGLTASSLARMFIKEGMSRHCTEQVASKEGNAPRWDGNVRPFYLRKGTQ